MFSLISLERIKRIERIKRFMNIQILFKSQEHDIDKQ